MARANEPGGGGRYADKLCPFGAEGKFRQNWDPARGYPPPGVNQKRIVGYRGEIPDFKYPWSLAFKPRDPEMLPILII